MGFTDLSHSLSNEQPLSLLLRMPLDFGQRSELAARVFHYTAQALVLCGRVVNLIHGGVESTTGHSDGLLSQWSTLVEELGSWYGNRPEEFKPMVEVDGESDAFPTVLFTTGAALLSNQLYHTAMLLLLSNRPRTFKVGNYKASTSMSSLWHARRICGISLANDCRGSWDPSLLASFVTAARRMTHSTQHQLVLSRLREVGRITGWNINHYWTSLREEWGL